MEILINSHDSFYQFIFDEIIWILIGFLSGYLTPMLVAIIYHASFKKGFN